MSKNLRDENTDMLMRAVMSADSIDECYDFFRDLCTDAEIKIMSQRLQVARMLKERHVYSDIVKKTEAGTATISRISNTLANGTGGYAKALEKAENKSCGGEVI